MTRNDLIALRAAGWKRSTRMEPGDPKSERPTRWKPTAPILGENRNDEHVYLSAEDDGRAHLHVCAFDQWREADATYRDVATALRALPLHVQAIANLRMPDPCTCGRDPECEFNGAGWTINCRECADDPCVIGRSRAEAVVEWNDVQEFARHDSEASS